MSISVNVDLGRILTNLKLVKVDAKDKLICSVVKANAYGHGSIEVAKALESESDYFAVANVEEGILLRQSGITKPILSFTCPFEGLESCINYDITVGISTPEQAIALLDVSQKLSKLVRVHVQIDSGMGRFGVRSTDELNKLLSIVNGLEIAGVYSHLYSQDSFSLQVERFKFFENIVKEKYPRAISHICATSAISSGKIYGDMVRPGIALYGYPSSKYLPSMTISSKVLALKKLEPNVCSGYEGIFKSGKNGATIAIIEGGYADGIFRNRRGVCSVLHNGEFLPIVSVCMDSVSVIASSTTRVGDEVLLVGESEGVRYYFDDIAKQVGTIPYELMLNTGKRARINYFDFKN